MYHDSLAFFRKVYIFLWLIILLLPISIFAEDNPRQIIVKFKEPFKVESLHTMLSEGRDSLSLELKASKIRRLFDWRYSKIAESTSFYSLGLNRFVILDIPTTINTDQFLARLGRNPGIEYAQMNHTFKIHTLPNDPRISEQWLIPRIHLNEAWDYTLGDRSIILCIIDTGIDYNHEDLNTNIWLNPGEDLNGNGLVEPSDFNNVDDDGNGFVDDVHGWDFTDAPHFPDGGDYLNPDNDPLDEHGHGTAVAGIAAAAANNGTGIAGVAPNCRIMNLRAGTSQGLLEEDDVASAIVYAVDNGARVINMSFGDKATSQMLRDVVQFAVNSGCALIASCGNSASADVHYPSGFPGVISVGATSESGVLAGFSNFGSTVDLVAPGVNLLSTSIGNQYAAFSGTSAAAPVVAGLAGLILSQQPFLTSDDVRNILVSSTDDISQAGWDTYYAAGRINALRALQIEYASQAKIISPKLDDGFSGSTIPIVGSASGALLQSYELTYGLGVNPDEWVPIAIVQGRQVISDTLGQWLISDVQDSNYIIRLKVNNKDGSTVEDRTHIFIDRTAPKIFSEFSQQIMIEENRHGFLLEFTTDDITRASIFYRSKNTDELFREIPLGYEVNTHRYFFTDPGFFEYHISVSNKSGLTTVENEGSRAIDLTGIDVETSRFTRLNYSLPSLYLISKTSDFDGDGNRELIASELSTDQSFGKLTLFEFEDGRFLPHQLSSHVAIPRDIGDSDNDGLPEILVGAGPISLVYESPEAGAFPTEIVWADTNDFWASRFADLDSDGKGEIIARIGNTFSMLETIGNNQYALIDSFPNPTEGTNGTGIPHVEIGDYDGDGRSEILMGDYDGDIYIYETTGNDQFEFTWSDSLPLLDAIDFISSGDYDGDGITEFAAGCHSSQDLDAEHEYDGRYWIFRIYDSAGDNSFRVAWEQAFFGFASPADFASGLSSGDVNNDGRDELLINIFPDFYVIEFDELSSYSPIGYFKTSRSQANAIGDFNGDRIAEFFIHTGEETVALQDRSSVSQGGPPAPAGFQTWPLDENHVHLEWLPVSGAEGYQIYRGDQSDLLFPLAATDEQQFIDSSVQMDSIYWYSVSAIDSSLNPVEGRNTGSLSARPGARPFCESATFLFPNQIRLRFSEVMNKSILNVAAYYFSDGLGQPLSAIHSRSGEEVILTLQEPSLAPGSYFVDVRGVRDRDRTPIDTTRNRAYFEATGEPATFYLISAELIQSQTIALTFSEPVDSESGLGISNYSIEPNLRVKAVAINPDNVSQVHLTIAEESPIGALGFNYVISVQNLFSESGIALQTGQGSQASLVFFKNDLSQVFTYPNPCRISRGENAVTFANLTREATIKILTISGKVIRTIEETDGNGGATWDLTDENGNEIPAGIYLYYAFNNSGTKTGKFAIIK